MKARIFDFHTDIFPTEKEVKELCTPGRAADTCIWLLMAPTGWECAYFNKPSALMDRWEKGLTTAKRDGCEKVKEWSPGGKVENIGDEVEF